MVSSWLFVNLEVKTDSCFTTEFHEIITNAIIESVCDTVDLKSQFILVYAAFIVALHNIGDIGIGAYFIEKLIQKFDSIMTERHQASNLLTLICHVYNLGVSKSLQWVA